MTAAPVIDDIDFVDLVRRCQAGEAAARRQLYSLKAAQVLAWSRRLAPRGRDGEDVAQDVFLAIFSGSGGFRGDSSFDGWLFKITRNTAFRRPTLLERFTTFFEPGTPEPESPAEGSDPWLAEILREALAKLPEDQREVVILKDVEERSASEVAELLDVPEGTVRSRLRLARERLERELRRRGVDR